MSGPVADLDPYPILAAIGVTDAAAIRITTGIGGAALFRVERKGEVQALRVYGPGEERKAERERAAMEAAQAGGVPVSPVQRRGDWSGRPIALLEWCQGGSMMDVLGRRPWRAFGLGQLLGRVQARLHAAPLPDETRFSDLDWVSIFGEVDPALRARLAAAPGRRALLHLDLHPANVMVAGDRITGLIDWENARIGDPRADVARTWSVLRLAPMPPEARRPGVRLVRRALEVGWRRGYREVAGRPSDLAPFLAWAAAAMVHDLSPKIGRPGIWFASEDLDPIQRIAADLRVRAGVDG